MNPNMSIYRRLNPRLLEHARMGLGLSLLHWANMFNISLTHSLNLKCLSSFHLEFEGLRLDKYEKIP